MKTLILMIAAAVLLPQTVRAAPYDQVLEREGAVAPGQQVRIRTLRHHHFWTEGRLLDVSGEHVTLLADGDTTTIRVDEVGKLQVWNGAKKATGRGAVIGLTVGGAASLAIGVHMANSWDDAYAWVAALGAAGGIAVSAALGAAIGSTIEIDDWEDRSFHPAVITGASGEPGLVMAWRF